MLNYILLQAASQGWDWQQFIWLGALVLVFYFFMIRPQQKKQKDQRKFVDAIKKGDEVVTIGGLHGRIADVEDSTFLLEVDKGFKIRVEKSAVSFEASKRETKQ